MNIDLKSIEDQYDELINNIPNVGVPPKEAERLATLFFKASYEVNKIKRIINSEMILLQQVSNALWTKAYTGNSGGTQEKRELAKGDMDFLKATKKLEETKGNLDYFKGLYDIMVAGHVFYKYLSRE